MPDIAVAASSAAVAKSTPAAPGNSANAPADGQSTGLFAAVLQRQMENPAPNQAAVVDPAAIATTSVDPAPAAAGDLAALLPMLMGSAMLASTASKESVGNQGIEKPGTDEGDASGTEMPLVIALPTSTTGPITTPVTNRAGGTSTVTADAASATAATANLAAAPDPAATGAKPDVKSDQQFEALLVDNRDVRLAGLPANPIHAAPVASHTVETAVGSHGWDAEVGNHMVWMSSSQSSRADLVLTPPQMGRIEISLTMSGDQATATFVSANPAVRDAIESAIPRLREILADAGVTLGQTQVGSEAPKQWANDSENRDNSFRGSAIAPGAVGVSASASGTASWTRVGLGLVDVFA